MAPPLQATSRYLATVIIDGYRESGQDCNMTVRCNGRMFFLHLTPSSYGADSPTIRDRYRRYAAAHWEGTYGRGDENVSEDENDDHDPEAIIEEFHKWLLAVCRPVFSGLAPDVPPSFDPEKLRAGEATPRLDEYLFPKGYSFEVKAVDDVPILEPDLHEGRDVEDEDDDVWYSVPQAFSVRQDLIEEVRRHVPFIDASKIEVSFADPEDALSKMPARVVVPELPGGGGSGQIRATTCFFKRLENFCDPAPLENVLETHLQVLKSNTAPDLRVARLLGIVTSTKTSGIQGMLLTYVESDGRDMMDRSYSEASLSLRQRWAGQVRDMVARLHDAGVVWGEAAPENLMVDKNDDVWIINLGSYPRVDLGGHPVHVIALSETAGTKESDLQGLERVVGFLGNEGWRGGNWGRPRTDTGKARL